METRFGKFRLVAHIGGGRLSQVFRVTPLHVETSGVPVALKRVNPAAIGEPAFVQLVVREAKILTRLSHPSLCRCLELGVVDGSAFLTLDLVDGCTVRALLRSMARRCETLPVSAVVALGCQAADVLDYCHRRNSHPLAHLDLSPQNVMISRTGQIKLIDFGIARHLDGRDPPPLGGKVAGTVGYMSPEQARGAAIDLRADQYGLGILLWEMLANQRLFRGNTVETWQRMQAGLIPPAEHAFPRLPDKLSAVIYRLLSPEPAGRFADMSQAAAALRGCISSPRSGQQQLAARVDQLLADPDFDPFDNRSRPPSDLGPAADIPQGGAEGSDYDEISIQVDHGLGSPTSQLRSVLPGGWPPDSPFLETLAELPATAGAAGFQS